VTPNVFTADSSIYDFAANRALTVGTGSHPIATGMGSSFWSRLMMPSSAPVRVSIDVSDGRVLLTATSATARDDTIVGLAGMGGQGVLAIPVPYNGWVQQLPAVWKDQLTAAQRNPAS
jgi:hypothetical protein